MPLLLASLFAVPLIINAGVFGTFEETYLLPRLYWLYGIVLPSALLLLLNWPLVAGRRRLWLIAALLGWLVLSALSRGGAWADWWGHPQRADGVLMHGLYALLAWAAWQWGQRDAAWPRKLALAVLLGGGLTALTGVLQQLHLMGVPNGNAFSGVSATPFGGTLGNRGYMGGAMALLLPLGLWGMTLLERRQRPWALAANVLMLWALLGSITRGAWLAGLLAVVALLWLTRGRWGKGWRTALLTGAAFFTVSLYAFDNMRAFGEGEFGLLGGSGRAPLWNSALVGIEQRPVFGLGNLGLYEAMNSRSADELFRESGIPGTLTSGFLNTDPTQPPSMDYRTPEGQKKNLTLSISKVHNEYLDYALTYGLPATVLFVSLLLSGIWRSAAARPALSAALVGYATYLLTWPDVVRFAPIAWFVLGLALLPRVSAETNAD